MRMTFIVPESFEVHGVPQRERPPCHIECEVAELVRMMAYVPWRFRSKLRPGEHVTYMALVRLPDSVAAPESWHVNDTEEVVLSVPLHLNRRVEIPAFPRGSNRLRIADMEQSKGEPC